MQSMYIIQSRQLYHMAFKCFAGSDSLTHGEFLLPSVGAERLWLQNESPTRSQMAEHLTKHSAQTGITPIKVHPLSEAESEYDIILWMS